ncbi:hypothetical protein PEX1_095750 [Penicillium expansum]|uniref:AB hydrolase-1 domain-containing protein n=1 Tax=Penicillium expansum TaxID=27334 RepID=A0A0A2JPB7_PENEN|nr:hypothetical protein PEX2_002510 [Penicillium expansum]KGO45492.1 hypothetical protein PEXP_061200 [Penicillium expansum]KGO56077.1 hypothetical protein PEX1_095750 [Penicillium expansum]KGO57277.1 hypothetical protein PEX2_002510 [Penicillium expansum]
MDKPTFVFSLGAWNTPIVFDAVRDRLNTLGYPSECPAHPSIGAEPPSLTLEDDVASLRRVLMTLADEAKDIVLVAHSYGGVVASTASEGLLKQVHAETGKPGGIVKIVYLAAFALDKGQSLLGMLGGAYLPWMKVEGDYVHADGAGDVGWQDLTVEQQEKWNCTTMHTSRAVFSGETTYEPWRDIPCSYIICEQDQALPPAIQEFFASKMGGSDTTHRLPSSHSPFLSMPDRLVGILGEIVKV